MSHGMARIRLGRLERVLGAILAGLYCLFASSKHLAAKFLVMQQVKK